MSFIFISHASVEDAKVNDIAAALNAGGIETWVDHQHGIEPGAIWSREIQDATNDCECGLFVLSPISVKSDYCEAEWNRILALKKKLYVALIEHVPLADYPLRLGIIQYCDLSKDFNGGMAALIQAITGKTALDATAPSVMTGKRVTSSYDDRYSSYSIPMHGRDADLAKALGDLKQAPLFIVGVGGLGKSRLAAEIVRVGDHNGAIWLRATETSTAEDLYRLLRQHYQLDATTPPDAVIEHVRNQRGLLVVIDNAEVIPDAAHAEYERLADRLVGAGVSLIVTTRVADWTIPRKRRTLEPSKLDPEAAAQVVQAMADELGIERDTAPFAETLAQAARLHPRLIELAVGKLDYEPLDEILDELRSLSHDTEEALKAMIGNTIAQMQAHDPDAPGVLKRLAVTRGGFTWDAAGAISGLDTETLRTHLKTLVEYRFVEYDPARERYDMDDLVWLAAGEDESAHRPHYDYYLKLAEQHDEQQDYYGLDADSANIEAAFDWSIQSNPDDALRLFNACIRFLSNRGRFTQRLVWIVRIIKAAGSFSDETRADVQNISGIIFEEYPFHDRRHNLHVAVLAYQKALNYRQRDKSSPEYAATQNNLGNAYRELAALEEPEANLRRAVEAEQEALTAYQEMLKSHPSDSLAFDCAMVQCNLGIAYASLASREEPQAHLHRALDAYQDALQYWTSQTPPGKTLNAPLAYALIQNSVGVAYYWLSQIEDRDANLHRAAAAYQDALQYRTLKSAPREYAQTQWNLHFVDAALGDLSSAIACAQEAEKGYRQMGYADDADEVAHWIAQAEQKKD